MLAKEQIQIKIQKQKKKISEEEEKMVMAVASGDLLSEKASAMRASLERSQTITDDVVSILGSFDHRLSALETAMRPTQVTHSTQNRFFLNWVFQFLQGFEKVLCFGVCCKVKDLEVSMPLIVVAWLHLSIVSHNIRDRGEIETTAGNRDFV